MYDMKHSLMICTVGGSPEPIVGSLKRWNPLRILFVPSKETRIQIEATIVPLALTEGISIDPGRYDVLELEDGQDFALNVSSLRQLGPSVADWLSRGADYQVVVDITGGTKCMSAALALHAHRWRCVFSYVGGIERSKGGVGVVISGKEQVLHNHNPWDALGFQAVEDFSSLFDKLAFASAASVAEIAMQNATAPARKRELNALKLLAEAYDAWDRFDHKGAVSKFTELMKYDNDLHAILGILTADRIRQLCQKHKEYLEHCLDIPSPSMRYVTDLLANAQRRQNEGRIDDAVARLYRAIESLAQAILAEKHNILNTKRVPLAEVPELLRNKWLPRGENGFVFLGLQDAYALLDAHGDEVGAKFKQLKLHDRERSPLTARNQSILAHGFERVSDKVFAQLWTAALELAGVDSEALPSFPRIGN